MRIRFPTFLTLLPLLLGPAGCAEFPALDGRLTPAEQAAPYPDLAPLGPVLARSQALTASARTAPGDVAAARGRAAALRARAETLRGPVVDGATRSRMRAGVDSRALQ